jgi:hypothetical protein
MSDQMTQHDDIHVTATVALCELLVKMSPVLAIKNAGEMEVCFHTFFTMALTGSERLTARTGRFNRGNTPPYPLNGRLDGLQGRSRRC